MNTAATADGLCSFIDASPSPFHVCQSVAKVLADRAAALGCDSIVMGTHGRGTVGTLMMGSVAAKVIHYSQVPVTLVK